MPWWFWMSKQLGRLSGGSYILFQLRALSKTLLKARILQLWAAQRALYLRSVCCLTLLSWSLQELPSETSIRGFKPLQQLRQFATLAGRLFV